MNPPFIKTIYLRIRLQIVNKINYIIIVYAILNIYKNDKQVLILDKLAYKPSAKLSLNVY